MKYCYNCGHELKLDNNKCINCNIKIKRKVSNKFIKTSLILAYLSYYPFILFGSIISYILGVFIYTTNNEYKNEGKKIMLLAT